jgi:hypothetical protein
MEPATSLLLVVVIGGAQLAAIPVTLGCADETFAADAVAAPIAVEQLVSFVRRSRAAAEAEPALAIEGARG